MYAALKNDLLLPLKFLSRFHHKKKDCHNSIDF